MKRPLAVVGFSCLCASFCVLWLDDRWLLASAVCLGLGCLLLTVRRFRRTAVLVTCLLACGWQFALGGLAMQPLKAWEPLDETDVRIRAVVLEDLDPAYGRGQTAVQVLSLETEEELPVPDAPLKLRLSSAVPLMAGDILEAQVHLYLPADTGAWSARNTAYAKGIALYGYLYEHRPVTLQKGEAPVFVRWRRALLHALERLLPREEATLTQGVVFGEKDDLSEEIAADFRTVGASHLLVVSGIHMSVAAGALLRLLCGRARRPGRGAAWLAGAGIVCFMLVAGDAPSVQRSGLMCLLALAAVRVNGVYDSLTALGGAMLVLCLLNPLSGGSIGLLLSFLAVLGITLLLPWWETHIEAWVGPRRFAGISRRVLQSAAVSLSASVFTLPVQILFLGGFSLLAPVSALVLIPLATVLLPCGLLAALLGCIPGCLGAARLPALLCGLAARGMRYTAAALGDAFPSGYVLSRGWMLLAAAGVLFLGMLLLWGGGQKRTRAVCLALAAAVTVCAFSLDQRAQDGRLRLAITGTGDAVVLCENTAAVLRFAGGSYGVKRILRENAVRKTDVFVLETLNESRRDAAAAVLEQTPASALLVPQDAYVDEKLRLLTSGAPIRYDTKEDLRLHWGGVWLEWNGEAPALRWNAGGLYPIGGVFCLEQEDGRLWILPQGETPPESGDVLCLREDEIVYIDRGSDGSFRFGRSDGWPK